MSGQPPKTSDDPAAMSELPPLPPYDPTAGFTYNEPSLSFLQQSTIDNLSGDSSSPTQAPSVVPNWDVILEKINWDTTDWRTWPMLQKVPWASVSQYTLDFVAAMWTEQYSIPPTPSLRSNPASIEQMRRFWAVTSRDEEQTQQAMKYFTTQAEEPFRPEDVSDNYGEPVFQIEGQPGGETVADSFYTLGFETDFLVAVAAVKDDPLADEHGVGDDRWMDQSLANLQPSNLRYAETVQTALAHELNAWAEVICTIKDEDEDTPAHAERLANIEKNVLANDPFGAFSTPAADGVVPYAQIPLINILFNHALATFFNVDQGLALHQASVADIDRFVNGVAMKEDTIKAMDRATQDAIRRLLTNRLEAAIYLSQQDPLAVELPGIKHRYRSWSVSQVRKMLPASVGAEEYTNGKPHYPSPFHMYRWMAAKVSSPVLTGEKIEPLHDALARICAVLRDRFRVHKDLPGAIPVGLQVSASHSHGFSLLELKRVAALVYLVEEQVRRLHRRERTTATGWRTCASVATFSALGGASTEPHERILQQPGHRAWRVLPRPARATREYLFARMEENLPAAELFARGGLAAEVFYRGVWLCTSVEQLGRAMAPERAGIRPAVSFRCAGKGRRTADDRTAAEDKADPLPFSLADRRRGTIEFRYMQHTMDPGHMMCWAAVCGALVSVARDSSPARFRAIVLDILGGMPLLNALGVHDRFQSGFRAGIARSQGGTFWVPSDTEVDYSNPFWPQP